jgi:hypothetical protein
MPKMKLVNGAIIYEGTAKVPSLPSIPVQGDPQQRRFNEAVRNAITGMYSGSDRFATAAEVPILAVTPPGDIDGAIPPAPTGLTADGAFENIILSWDYPDGSSVAYTRIYRATVDDFTQAAVIGNTEGKVWADPTGPGASFYYWVTNVSPDGVESPPNQVAGTLGTTAPDVDFLLSQLEGQVLESSLTADLSARIDLIDGTMPGSVSARIATETTERTEADSALSQQITTVQSTLNGQVASVQQTATANANAITGLSAQWTIKLDVNGRVAGMGVMTDGVSSNINMLADRFAIIIPGVAGSQPKVPFIATTINGVVGVGISSAFIGDAAIVRAKIADAAIDDAKIANLSAAKVTFGTMSGARISVGTLDANTIITGTLAAKLALITDAYITNAHIENLTIGGEKVQPNAVSNCAYMSVANAGTGGNFALNTWVDWDTAASGGGSGTGGGTGGSGGGSGGGLVTQPGGGVIS